MSRNNVFKLSGNMALGSNDPYGNANDFDNIKSSLKLLKSKQQGQGRQNMPLDTNDVYGGSYSSNLPNRQPQQSKNLGNYQYQNYNNYPQSNSRNSNQSYKDLYPQDNYQNNDYKYKKNNDYEPPKYSEKVSYGGNQRGQYGGNDRNQYNQNERGQYNQPERNQYKQPDRNQYNQPERNQYNQPERNQYNQPERNQYNNQYSYQQQRNQPQPPQRKSQQQQQPPARQPPKQQASYNYSGNEIQQKSIKQLNRQNRVQIQQYDPSEFVTCSQGCGRKFNPDSIDKHQAICKKVFQKKRKEFNTQQQRMVSNEQAKLMKKGEIIDKKLEEKKAREKVPKWKAQSLQLRSGVKQARDDDYVPTKQQKKILEQAKNDQFVKCKFCGRSFNQQAAKRHIPFCQTQMKKNQMKKK